MSDNKMYNILGIFKGLNDNAKAEQLNESVEQPTVYETVEPRGSIMEAVRSLEAKFQTFKESAKPDFLDVDKDGNKKEPFKKAVKDKKQVEEGQGPYELYNPKHPKFKANYEKYKAKHPGCTLAEYVAAMKKKEKGLAEGKYDEPEAPNAEAIAKRKRLQAIKDRQEDERDSRGSEKSNVRKVAGKAYGGSAQKDAPEADDLDEALSSTGGEITKKGNVTTHKAKKYGGAEEHPNNQTNVKDIMDRKSRHRIVDLGDPEDYDLDEAGYSAKKARAGKDIGKPGKNFSKIAKGAAERYGSKAAGERVAGAVLNKLRHGVNEGADQEKTIQSPKGEIVLIQREYDMDNTPEQRTQVYAPAGMMSDEVAHYINAEVMPSDEEGGDYQYVAMLPTFGELDEVAPPGAKAERMVKHIKKGYSKDGKLTPKEKSIAYATAWKAHNKGQVEESTNPKIELHNKETGKYLCSTTQSATVKDAIAGYVKKHPDMAGKISGNKAPMREGTEFGDTIKNSSTKFTKAKAAKLKEGRDMSKSQYFDEQIAQALANEQPGLDTSSPKFNEAVYNEIIAQGMTSKAARNIMLTDEDFLGDVATAYGYFCKHNDEVNNHSMGQQEAPVDAMQELDEIAKLAGLKTEMDSKVPGDSASPLTHTDVCPVCEMAPCACEHEELSEGADQEKTIDTPKGEIVLIQREYDFDTGSEQRTQIYAPAGMSPREVQQYVGAEVYPSDEEGSSYQYVAMLPTLGEVDEGNAFTGKLAATPQGRKFKMGNKTYKDTSAIEEADVEEGNEFSGALAAAKASGQKEFEVDGKRYTVKEDITLTADGDDVANLFRKLAGLDPIVPPAPEMPMATGGVEVPVDLPVSTEPGIPGQETFPQVDGEEVAEDGPKERDVEYVNTPREETAGPDAAFPGGTDLNRPKKMYKKEYPGDNPMAVKEAALWAKYESMISDIKK